MGWQHRKEHIKSFGCRVFAKCTGKEEKKELKVSCCLFFFHIPLTALISDHINARGTVQGCNGVKGRSSFWSQHFPRGFVGCKRKGGREETLVLTHASSFALIFFICLSACSFWKRSASAWSVYIVQRKSADHGWIHNSSEEWGGGGAGGCQIEC